MKTMQRELTGRAVLGITVGAFAIIIAVNMVLAVQAVRSFPGLEVKNSYVASQSFDRDRAAQQALGWTAVPSYDGQVMTIALNDAQGRPAQVREISVTIGRPTHVRDDVTPDFVLVDGLWRAPVRLAPGLWNIHLTAVAADGTVFRQRLDHYHGDRVGTAP